MRADALEGLSGRPGRGPHPGAAMSAAATGNGAARTLGELVGLLEDTYPLDWAESWDRVGLVLGRSEEHTSELQSRGHLVCRLLLEKKKQPGLPVEHEDQIQAGTVANLEVDQLVGEHQRGAATVA